MAPSRLFTPAVGCNYRDDHRSRLGPVNFPDRNFAELLGGHFFRSVGSGFWAFARQVTQSV